MAGNNDIEIFLEMHQTRLEEISVQLKELRKSKRPDKEKWIKLLEGQAEQIRENAVALREKRMKLAEKKFARPEEPKHPRISRRHR